MQRGERSHEARRTLLTERAPRAAAAAPLVQHGLLRASIAVLPVQQRTTPAITMSGFCTELLCKK